MGSERWQQIERIYHAVADRPHEARAPFLDRECGGDAGLRAEVERMLAVESRGIGFLEMTAMDVVARALAEATPLGAGSRFGPYEIVALLGAGGMGEVYKARDTRLNRTVAIKVLSALPVADAERRRRLLQEARAASALKHPNIITLHDILTEDGRDGLVMEYVEGRSLDERIAGKRLPLREALCYALQIAGALAASHAANIVHRDLKPGNIMLSGEETGRGMVTVLDFGLAKFTGPESQEERTQAMATGEGRIFGTVAYMSPEQAEGRKVDARSDIFSFGVVFYEMLTGRKAFLRTTTTSTRAAILGDDLGPAPGIPESLQTLLSRCLRKDRDKRAQSMADIKLLLEEFREEIERPPAESRTASGRWKTWIAVAVLAAVSAASGWLALGRSRSKETASFERLTFRRGLVQGARFAPDGRSVIYAATFEGQAVELFSMQPGSPESSRPLGFSSTGVLSISRTGEMAVSSNCRIDFWGDCVGTLAQKPVAGGAPREILGNVRSADWMPDGKQLAVSMRAANGKRERLEFPIGKVLFEASGTGWAGDPRVSPGGDLVAFADHYYFGNDGSVAVVDLQGHRRTLTRKFQCLQGLAWSLGGKEIWFTGCNEGNLASIYAVTLSGALRLVAQVPADLRIQDIAPDGRLLLTRTDLRANVYFLGAGESEPHDLTWLDWALSPVLSADGKRVLMTESGAGTGGKAVLYLRGTDGSPAVRLGDQLSGHALSPDGLWAAARSDDQERLRIVLLPVKAGKPVWLETGSLEVAPNLGDRTNIAWLPDSRRILFAAAEPGHFVRTYVQDINGGSPRPVTPEGISGSVLSVDGTSLLALDSEAKAFLYPLGGGTPKPLPVLTTDERLMSFSEDARSIFVARRSERLAKVWRVDLSSGRMELWRELPIDPAGQTRVNSVQITPDGKSLVYAVVRNSSELYLAKGLR
uniref:Serine/threonine protein kinase n=1 Tax=Solibacter usitatus (strain Ellin6076) TaxID=234267 RepID=Q01VZ5_SOLUE